MMTAAEGVYGAPHPDLAQVASDAPRFSPLVPGAAMLEDAADASLTRLVVAAPPAVLERRYVLAQALRILATGGELVALAPKDRGGARLRGELEAFGCVVAERAGRHQRICELRRPAAPTGLDAAIAEGAPRIVPALGLWSQPGVFSWDRVDPGSAQLLKIAGDFSGRGADLGCGIGVLATAVLGSPNVTALTAIDIDRRAVLAAQHNLDDPRVRVIQHDLRAPPPGLEGLDFVVMNPPFHDGGQEDRRLGQIFIARAAALLRRGGICRLVANVGMPYEAPLAEHFAAVKPLGVSGGYKLFEARR
jgi:16S rRNA (guanine1207-N2)-methyltransferase